MRSPNERKALTQDDLIAVVGMGCQYPGDCDSPESYWTFLRRGGFAVSEIPAGRWPQDIYDPAPHTPGKSTSRWGGFLSDPFPKAFDAAFFDIPPREARALDPQQRLLLEVTWRACEDAGLVPDPDNGRPIGVFLGISTTDYHGAQLWRPGLSEIDHFTATGASFAAAAGRLSYVFGFEGPCLAIDTACSSSLVAVHQACQALRLGECEAAVVAGVNALLTPNLYVCLTAMGLMSADGRCKAFDASGDGYVRAEGCGALLLKTMAQARQDGDRILALIRGSAVNQDGRSNGLTAPRQQAQVRVIRRALDHAGLSAGDIDYVETHGTGTPLGDAIELGALIETYAADREPASPLLVGSVKTNIGHLEAGAGMAGLIKTIQSICHGELPPHLHLNTPTPEINWTEVALKVPTRLTPWPQTGRPRRAAVSAFGFSGTNAHVIVEEAPPEERKDFPSPDHVLLPLSARTPAALNALATTLADWLMAMPRNLADVGLTLGIGRPAFACRRAVVGTTSEELATLLRDGTLAKKDPPDRDALRRTLEDLALLWTAGGQVDWERLYRPYGAQKIALPGHPFHRQSYWLDPVVAVSGQSRPAFKPPSPPASSPAGIVATGGAESLRAFIDERARMVLTDQPRAPLDPDQPLLEQGFTSLMGMELRKSLETDLGIAVPSTLFFNYPSINRIVGFFLGKTVQAVVPKPPETLPPQQDAPEFAFLDDLSDEDLAALIDRELNQL
jgi:acyl transferase domain-containing protein